MIGSVVPVAGTAVGAIVGAAVGAGISYFGGNAFNDFVNSSQGTSLGRRIESIS